MAIFGKKRSLEERFNELLAEMGIPDDKREALFAQIGKMTETAEDDADKPDTSEEIEKAEEDIAEKGPDSQSVKDRVDESVAAQEEEHGQEDSQDAKDRVDEAEGEERAEEPASEDTEEQAEQDVLKQLAARISALEETIAKLTDSHADGDFGMQPVAPPQGDTSEQINEAVLRGYAGANAYKYR